MAIHTKIAPGRCWRSRRSKRSRTKRMKFGPREKWGESKKVGRKGVEERKEGNACPQTPGFWKTPTGFHGWVHLLIDNFVTELKSQYCYMYLHTRLEGNKSNVCLNTSFSYGLTPTVHFVWRSLHSLAAEKINRWIIEPTGNRNPLFANGQRE